MALKGYYGLLDFHSPLLKNTITTASFWTLAPTEQLSLGNPFTRRGCKHKFDFGKE